MPVVTNRNQVLETLARFEQAKAVMPVICYDGREDMEAALMAVQGYAREHEIKDPALGLSITYGYAEMSQAGRVWRWGDSKAGRETGLRASLNDMDVLCGTDGTYEGPFSDVYVLPNLDHADVEAEEWVWDRYADRLGTVLMDGSLNGRGLEKNIELTARAVEKYKDRLVIEGCLQRPAVEGAHGAEAVSDLAQYGTTAKQYVDNTSVDLLVVELGSTQQSLGWAEYRPEIARAVRDSLGGRHILVLHGGSSIRPEVMGTLGEDGVVRFNLWTRMGREASQAAAENVANKLDDIRAGDKSYDFRLHYRNPYVDRASSVVRKILTAQHYENLLRTQ